MRENEKRCYAPPLFILRRATEDATLVRVRDWQINGIFTSFINILGQLPKRAANKTHTQDDNERKTSIVCRTGGRFSYHTEGGVRGFGLGLAML